ncbi:hypothetical protein [Ottowia caeni]|uniref:hypothetical protein n=1 Tax=Ottowia caeni TaxID=2870339 RepID=UPI003D7028D5
MRGASDIDRFDFFDQCHRRGKSAKIQWVSLLLALAALGSVSNILLWGYADPLSSALMFTSFALVLQYANSPYALQPWIIACACGLLAALTKQPGLVWVGLSLPVIALFGVWRWRWPAITIIFGGVTAILAAIWPVFIAPDFSNNQGVLAIAEKNGGYLASGFYAFSKYILNDAFLGVLLVVSTGIALSTSRGRFLWIFAIAPFLAIWFIIGSYEKRHGMHVILMAVYLAISVLHARGRDAAQEIQFPAITDKFETRAVSLVLGIFVVCLAVGTAWSLNATALRDGNKLMFSAQFGDDALPIYEDMVSSKRKVFTTSNYQYGMLFNRVDISRLDPAGDESLMNSLLRYLREYEIEYALTAGDWGFGPYSETLLQLAEKCPAALELVASSELEPRPRIYRVHQGAPINSCVP